MTKKRILFRSSKTSTSTIFCW